MKKRILITTAIFAAIHVVLLISLVMIIIVSGDTRDDSIFEPTPVERVAGDAIGVLLQPALSVCGLWKTSRIVEWAIFITNSILWGICLAFIINAPRILKRAKLDNKVIEETY